MEVKEGREAAKLPPSHHLKLSRSLSKDGGNLSGKGWGVVKKRS